jgi:flagellar basal body-associated protein FliL
VRWVWRRQITKIISEESNVADQNGSNEQHGGEQTAEISGTVQIKPQGQGGGDKGGEQKPVEQAPPKDNSKRKFIVIGVVLVLVVVALFFYWRSTFTEDTDDAQVDGNLYQVSSRVSGQVVHVDVEEEQFVHAGDPIAEVDPKDYEVALEQAQANLASAQAQYEQATVNVPITNVSVRTTLTNSGSDVLSSEASVSQAEAQAQAAKARVDSAKAQALKSQLDVDRYTPLVAKDVISKQQYDAAVAQATADQAALDEAQRNVKAQQDMVHQAEQKLAMAQQPEAGGGAAGTGAGGRGSREAGAGTCRPGTVEPELYEDPCAHDRHCEQKERVRRRKPERWAVSDDDCAARRSLGDGELQGDATQGDEGRPRGKDHGRRSGWPQVYRQGGADRWSYRIVA